MARTGCPPKYKTKEEMQEVIDQYFRDCEGRPYIMDDGEPLRDKYGDVILLDQHPPTVTGLALALGFTSRQALLNYKAKKEFVDTVTRAKTKCEEYAERRLYDRDGAKGAEFSLKYNFKWAQEKDKEKDEESHAVGVVLIPEVGAGNV